MRMVPVILLAGLLGACGDSGAGDPGAATAAEAPAGGSVANVAGDLAPASEAIEGSAAAGSDAQVTGSGAGEGEGVGAEVVDRLPLQPGFYITAGDACADASNASLQLLRRSGINTSRVPCDFTSIEKIGAARYRVTESCTEGGEAWGTEEQVMTSTSVYEILSDTRFKVVAEGGWENEMQFCPQSSLPEPWRDNDISDLIE